jgi:two-component system, NtrC family, sensor histidine kinase HydH
MGHTIMDLLRGGRWARGGLMAATLAMGASLVVTSLLSYRSVVHASGLVSRSQGEAFLRSTFFLMRPGQAPPDPAALATLLQEQAPVGLRYLGVFEPDGRPVAEAGSRLREPALKLSLEGGRDPWVFLDLGERIRMVAGPPPEPQERRGGDRANGPERHRPRPTIAIEFEPLVARQLRAQAARALGFGVVAAVCLMAVAALFSRQLVHHEAAERRFEEQRRLAVLGEMSSVIAHELRNPLASLKGNAQLLAERLPPDGRERKKAERIVLEAQRLETLSGDLLDFSRSGPIDRKETDPAALLRAAAESVDASRIALSLEGAPARFPLDGARIRQALTNLLTNAVQASPGATPATARVAMEGDHLVFTVSDRGPGIPPEDLERIFEPFYTTRPSGTGLGLAVAQRIVQMHGGTLTAASEPGGGASFRVAIPRA